MPYYRSVGDVPRRRHTRHRTTAGQSYEELFGEEGFSSASSLLYHRSVPAAIVAAVAVETSDERLVPNHPLLPRHVRPNAKELPDDPVLGRRLLFGNADVRISAAAASTPSRLYRNAIGDELVYVQSGRGYLETMLGAIEIASGDHVVVPRALVHRWVPRPDDPMQLLVVESSSHIRSPRRYLSAAGQFLEHSPYCERDLRGPDQPLLAEGTDVEVVVRHRGHDASALTTVVTHARHPFDVVGWDGCAYPYAFSIHDFAPITGRLHQPPPVHQVFEGDGFVVCDFVPRRLDDHPDAIPLPYYHSNVDSDEVLFYAGGDYAARRGTKVGVGSVTLHPAGLVHGPNPEAYTAGTYPETSDELAVMIDTFRPLGLGPAALDWDDAEYPWTWARR